MERIGCGVIQDLLRSYSDGLTGEGVTELVKSHLEECPSCQKSYEELEKQQEDEAKKEVVREEKFLDKLKGIRYYVIGVFIGMMIPIGIIVLFFLVNWIMRCVEALCLGYYF